MIVRGLKGFEDIDFKVDAKTPNANVKARELADNAYLGKAEKNENYEISNLSRLIFKPFKFPKAASAICSVWKNSSAIA